LFRLQLRAGESLFAQLLDLAFDVGFGVGDDLVCVCLGGRLDLFGARFALRSDVLRTRVSLFSNVLNDCIQTHSKKVR